MSNDPTALKPGEQDTHIDTKFLTLVVIAFACLIAFVYIIFPRHDPGSAIGPGATATPSVGGGGPGGSPGNAVRKP